MGLIDRIYNLVIWAAVLIGAQCSGYDVYGAMTLEIP